MNLKKLILFLSFLAINFDYLLATKTNFYDIEGLQCIDFYVFGGEKAESFSLENLRAAHDDESLKDPILKVFKDQLKRLSQDITIRCALLGLKSESTEKAFDLILGHGLTPVSDLEMLTFSNISKGFLSEKMSEMLEKGATSEQRNAIINYLIYINSQSSKFSKLDDQKNKEELIENLRYQARIQNKALLDAFFKDKSSLNFQDFSLFLHKKCIKEKERIRAGQVVYCDGDFEQLSELINYPTLWQAKRYMIPGLTLFVGILAIASNALFIKKQNGRRVSRRRRAIKRAAKNCLIFGGLVLVGFGLYNLHYVRQTAPVTAMGISEILGRIFS